MLAHAQDLNARTCLVLRILVLNPSLVPIRKKSILNISLEENTYQFDRVPTANEPYVSLEGDHVDT